jgi:hypothetical protein
MVVMLDLGSNAVRRVGSSPILGNLFFFALLHPFLFSLWHFGFLRCIRCIRCLAPFMPLLFLMPTIHQLIKKPRLVKKLKSKAPALHQSPQKKGVCVRVYTRSPKKPNSAKRKVTNVLLSTG